MHTRSGGRYVIRNGKPVLVERSGHQQATPEPAPGAAEQPAPAEESHDEDTQETPAGGA